MEFLNNTASAEFIINLTIQLLAISFVGWGIILFIKKKAAIYRSLISSSIMISLLAVVLISTGFQLMNISWGKPLWTITQEQIMSPKELSQTSQADSEAVVEVKAIPKDNASIATISTTKDTNVNPPAIQSLISLLINCFGIIWLSGILFVVIKLCYSLIFLRGFKAATDTKLDADFMVILREVSKVFKFKYIPEICVSKAVESPVAVGISKLSVFIPENLYGNMTEDEFRSILFHEFAHIQHKDHLFSILNKGTLGMNWWNPLVYNISSEQNQAREDICDNYAIKGVKSAETYSNCLVNLAEKICLISNLPATAGMAGRKSGLEKRIKSIMSKERNTIIKTKKTTKLAISIICVLIIVFIGGIGGSFAKANSLSKPENSKQEIRNKLKETKIDHIEFKDTKISEAVKIISEKYKIGIILKLTPQEREKEPKVDLVLKKKNLYQVIYFLCKAVKFKFRIRTSAIAMQSFPFPNTKEEIQRTKRIAFLKKKMSTKKMNTLTENKLTKIIFPEITFKNADIFTVIRFLNRASKRNDPGKVGVGVHAGFDKKTADALPKITMKFRNASMKETLHHLYNLTGLKYKIKEGAVILFPDLNKKILKKLVFIKTKFYEKPKMNSPLSEYTLLTSPKIVVEPGRESKITMTSERFIYNKKYAFGIIMNFSANINEDDIDLKGKISLLPSAVFPKDKRAEAYLIVKKEMFYNIKIKDQDKLYKIIFKDREKIFELTITAMLIDYEGKPIKKLR